jgi:hypothetical protein
MIHGCTNLKFRQNTNKQGQHSTNIEQPYDVDVLLICTFASLEMKTVFYI